MRNSTLFFIVVFFSFQLHSMEERKVDMRTITLSIRPSAPYTVGGFKDHDDHHMITTMLSNVYFENNNIELLQNSSTFQTNKGDVYTTENIMSALIEKKVHNYPLHWHKKINQLHDKDVLNIVVEQDGKRQPVLMSALIKQRLLRYLLHDVTDLQRNSLDLCKEVIMEHVQPNDIMNEEESLLNYIDIIHPAHFKPGDILGIFNVEALDGVGYSCSLTFGNFAIALGDDLFLTKLGAGGMLYVSKLQALKQFWKCPEHARISPAIGKKDYFLLNVFRAIVYRNIIMSIDTKSAPLGEIEHFPTRLSGLRRTSKQKQVKLRSESTVFDGCEQQGKYLLCEHKKLRYLVGDELLTICIAGDNDQAMVMYLPSSVKRKLLAYLLRDTETLYRNCFDLCKKLCLHKCHKGKLLHESIDYSHQWKYIAENELQPGDAIALGLKNSIKYFAVALGNGKYMSRCEAGAPFVVTDMQQIKSYSSSEGFVLIKPAITIYAKFWKDITSGLADTSILFTS